MGADAPGAMREVVTEWAGAASGDALVWCAARGGAGVSTYVLADPDWVGQVRTGMGRVVRAFVTKWGSARVIRNAWRRVFCRYVDVSRTTRGDGVLPRARVRLPEGGCGPPGVECCGERPRDESGDGRVL